MVSLPSSLAAVYFADSTGDSATSAYLTLAQLAMNSAIIYAIMGIGRGERLSVKRSYYEGSIGLIRLILLALVMVLISMVFIFGLIILTVGLLMPDTPLMLGEKLLLGLLAGVLIIPGLYLIARSLMAPYVIFDSDIGPFQAIAQSWDITKGKGWKFLVTLVMLAVYVIALLVIPSTILLVLQSYTNWSILLLLLQIIVGLVVIPLTNLYLYNCYQGLKR